MAIVRQTMEYDGPGGPFEGVVAYDDEVETPRPGVLIVPNVLGQKEADNLVAERIAGLGYVGFACDVFGKGKRSVLGAPDASRYMDELNADRGLLRDRLAASLSVLQDLNQVDAGRIAAIGYCFGGKCVLDMARAGMEISAGVTFHGVYDRPDYASATPIKAKLLICHGWDDPLGPPDAVAALAQELTEAGADWEIDAYGGAGHAFTDKERADGKPGFRYDERADMRSWEAMTAFLAGVFI